MKKTKRLIMLQGLPASGKSTWAKEQVEKGNGIVKRINKDDLRAMLDNSKWSKRNEAAVLTIRDTLISFFLRHEHTVIVDDTNLHPKHLEDLAKLAEENGCALEIKMFNVSVDECIARDAEREKSVGEKVIRDMYERYIKKPEALVAKFTQDSSLPPAIICDLDGTLCLMGDRDPYDASTCENDTPNYAVSNIVGIFNFHAGRQIIFVSGRSSKYREQTIRWLERNLDVHLQGKYKLFMRAEGDTRKDSIVKKEILEAHIKGKYYIEFVLDDRQQVVDMWRANGLTCLQVAPGNF